MELIPDSLKLSPDYIFTFISVHIWLIFIYPGTMSKIQIIVGISGSESQIQKPSSVMNNWKILFDHKNVTFVFEFTLFQKLYFYTSLLN